MSKVVLITGATSGMGELSAKFLADNGYTVYAGTRDENASTGEGNLKNIYIDVTKTPSIKNAVSTIIKNEGKIDVLVNNAGYGLLSTLEDGTDEEIYHAINRIISQSSIQFEKVEEEIVAQLAQKKSLSPGSAEYKIAMDQLLREKVGDPQKKGVAD